MYGLSSPYLWVDYGTVLDCSTMFLVAFETEGLGPGLDKMQSSMIVTSPVMRFPYCLINSSQHVCY